MKVHNSNNKDRKAKEKLVDDIPLSHNEEKILRGNKHHVANFTDDLAQLTFEATKHFAILTCMDPRIDPCKILRISEGDAYVIRNAGGRASDDAIRSLVVSTRAAATTEYFVIHHTDCAMAKFNDAEMREDLKRNLGPCKLHGKCPISPCNRDKIGNADYVAFLTFKDLKKSVIDDVKRLREQPLISKKVKISGYIYDVHTGKLIRVRKACEAGLPIKERCECNSSESL
jgi:carbonic anhydrase